MICYIKKLVFYCLCLGFIACGTDTGSSQSSSSLGGGSSASSSGTSSNDLVITLPEGSLSQSLPLFSLRVTDAPIDDAVKVVLTFTAIELMAGDEASSVRFTYRSPRRIDLLQLYGANTESLLDKVPLPAGEYTEIRLLVSDEPLANFIEFRAGGIQELDIPSGSSSGIKLKSSVSMLPERDSSYTIDFDLRKSIVMAGASGRYLLKPVLRLVDDFNMGHVRGTVDQSLLLAESCSDSDVDSFNSVYVYQGHDVIPGDINLTSTRTNVPITTSSIRYDAQLDSYLYEAAFLPEGKYTVALTCNADKENLQADDDLKFFNIEEIVVLVNNIIFL